MAPISVFPWLVFTHTACVHVGGLELHLSRLYEVEESPETLYAKIKSVNAQISTAKNALDAANYDETIHGASYNADLANNFKYWENELDTLAKMKMALEEQWKAWVEKVNKRGANCNTLIRDYPKLLQMRFVDTWQYVTKLEVKGFIRIYVPAPGRKQFQTHEVTIILTAHHAPLPGDGKDGKEPTTVNSWKGEQRLSTDDVIVVEGDDAKLRSACAYASLIGPGKKTYVPLKVKIESEKTTEIPQPVNKKEDGSYEVKKFWSSWNVSVEVLENNVSPEICQEWILELPGVATDANGSEEA